MEKDWAEYIAAGYLVFTKERESFIQKANRSHVPADIGVEDSRALQLANQRNASLLEGETSNRLESFYSVLYVSLMQALKRYLHGEAILEEILQPIKSKYLVTDNWFELWENVDKVWTQYPLLAYYKARTKVSEMRGGLSEDELKQVNIFVNETEKIQELLKPHYQLIRTAHKFIAFSLGHVYYLLGVIQELEDERVSIETKSRIELDVERKFQSEKN